MPSTNDDLTIKCAGQTVGTWQRFSVTRGIELLPSVCEITTTEGAAAFPNEAVVAPFDKCEIFIGSDKILTGYVDVYAPEIAKDHHEVTIACRSATEDIVDCSVDVFALGAATGTWQIAAGTIGQAAKLLCKPYNITVVLPDDDPQLNSPGPTRSSRG